MVYADDKYFMFMFEKEILDQLTESRWKCERDLRGSSSFIRTRDLSWKFSTCLNTDGFRGAEVSADVMRRDSVRDILPHVRLMSFKSSTSL